MNSRRDYIGLIFWLLLCFSAGAFGGYFEPAVWYEQLSKPNWTPADWIFPVVWPILYLFMGISVWLIWKEFGFKSAKMDLRWFLIQLVLNALWPWLFFGRHDISTALAEISLLWIAIFFTTVLFWQKNTLAAYLLLPYLLWIGYAFALNFAIWKMNPV